MARVTAAEAAQIISQQQREQNSRYLPPTLERIKVLQKDEYYLICNVGPWAHHIDRGPFIFDVPAYDPAADSEGKGYASSKPIPTVFRHVKIIDELEYGWCEDDGRMVALDAIGVGANMNPANSLVPYGLFVPEGKSPSRAEIEGAKAKLSAYTDRLISEARDAYDLGPEARKATITERHLWAARLRGIDEKWVYADHTQASVKCGMCGKFNPNDIARCTCGTILNYELFQKIQREQEQMLEQVTRPVPKAK